ncbi:P-loop containing nucleoside triphosphate hydrolase protein [Globomyces pollinis-pini]|nr:P-loop containing nucleoside triphosphate hydrolase protein [Globomyces pollinis-pini]
MSLFQLLGAGAKFNKNKYQNDWNSFQKKETKSSTVRESESVENSELDFFKSTTVPSTNKNSITNTLTKVDQKEENDVVVDPLTTLEEANQWRKDHHIKVLGTDVPHPFKTYSELAERYTFKSYLKNNLLNSGYTTPTPIQMQSIPIILHGRELMACAPTGSGKTLAFLLPILHDLKAPTKEGFRALIISPTRELASQIHRELLKLSANKPFKVCVLSKSSNLSNPNIKSSFKTFDILITTPLRLVYALKEESIQLNNVRHLVLDEADKLLELGFLDQVDEIFAACTSSKLQRSLFSATLTSSVEELGRSFMSDPLRVVIGQQNAATDTIDQKLLYVGQEEGKLIAIRQLVQSGLKPPCLIFVQSIERSKELFHELVYDGINVDVIHSERTQAQRDNIIQNFRIGKIWILISTELMARGIDFKGVNMVINYDFPQSIQSYIHRIGRTGRAGRRGEAITYFTKEDLPYLKSIVNVMKDSGCDVPDWMLTLKKPTKNMKKNARNRPVNRDSIKTISKYEENLEQKKKEMIQGSKNRKRKLSQVQK